MTDIEPKVKAAAELLDSLAREGEYPWLDIDWRQKVNAGRLDMTDTRDCILGQLGGLYELVIETIDPERRHREAFCGFAEDWLNVLKSKPARRKLYSHSNGKVWEVMSEYEADGTRKYVLREGDYDYIKTQYFVDALKDHPKPEFEYGDVLSVEGQTYLLIVGRDGKAMRIGKDDCGHGSIDWYSREGKLTKLYNSKTSLRNGLIK